MTRRRWFLLVLSFALSAVLIYVLINVGKIDLHATLQQLRSVRGVPFAKLLLLNTLLVLISTTKWRSIDSALRKSSDSPQSKTTSFALTSVGLAIGTFLPIQFSMSTARTFGTYLHGSAIKRGTGGTLYEQGFDVLMALLLAVASGVTWFWKGGGMMWTLSAVTVTALALLVVGHSVRMLRWFTAACAARTSAPGSWIGSLIRGLSDQMHSDLLNSALARRLVMLSVARFVVVVLMSIETAEAIGLHIPLWHMAAAIPFVVISSLIALTPGGLGVNELTCTAALSVFGTPLAIGAQWALANRVLIIVSYFVVAACSTTVLVVGRMAASSSRNTVQS
jgi:uncharacterized membrane protein YbhN (UPF0104 family)